MGKDNLEFDFHSFYKYNIAVTKENASRCYFIRQYQSNRFKKN
jgi:hypothetical protein